MNKHTKGNMTKLPAAVWVFIVFIAVVTLANIIAPDSEISEGENRVLAQFPEFSLEKLFFADRKWTAEFDDYVSDQFVLRDKWVGLKAICERAEGKTENGGVYFCDDGYLIARPTGDEGGDSAVNVRAISEFASKRDVPVYFALIPNSPTVNNELLPRFAYDGDQLAIIDKLYAASENVTCIDAASALMDGGGERFYHTDHHPTSHGAYLIYRSIMESMGTVPYDEGDYDIETVSQSFRGTAANSSGAWWTESDTIELYRRRNGAAFTMTVSDGKHGGKTYDSLYVRENLGALNQYTVFMDGNHTMVTVTTDNADGLDLLIIKDSFAHTIAPFIAEHCHELCMVDMRYFRRNMDELLKEHPVDAILVMYSVNNFKSERNLIFLNKE